MAKIFECQRSELPDGRWRAIVECWPSEVEHRVGDVVQAVMETVLGPPRCYLDGDQPTSADDPRVEIRSRPWFGLDRGQLREGEIVEIRCRVKEFGLAGIRYRDKETGELVDHEPDLRVFAKEVPKMERTGKGRYGLVLRRHPENPADANAIAVECWVRNPEKLYHIGWLWREDAAFIAGFVPAGTPLAAALAMTDFKKGEFYIGFHVFVAGAV